ncbi:MAG: hypothetical protein PHF86_05045 [Candidatus Nanoarchaeia archaeon]|nr:hypothetical protein [Candidatus Nanoarchaeia archaeon]
MEISKKTVTVKSKKLKSLVITDLTLKAFETKNWKNRLPNKLPELRDLKNEGLTITFGCDQALYDKIKHAYDNPTEEHREYETSEGVKITAKDMSVREYWDDLRYFDFTYHGRDDCFVDSYYTNFKFDDKKLTISFTIHYDETSDT